VNEFMLGLIVGSCGIALVFVLFQICASFDRSRARPDKDDEFNFGP